MRKIIDSRSALSRPRQFFLELANDCLLSRELAVQLFIFNFKAQYRQTILGIIWLLVPPLVFGIGLSIASETKLINFGNTEIPYIAYVIISMSLWQTFVEALFATPNSFKEAQLIILKTLFPNEALILSKLIALLVHFIPRLMLIISVMIWHELEFNIISITFILPLFNLILFGLVVGIFLTPLAALYEDFFKAIIIISGVWLCITPVVFPFPEITGLYTYIVNINPVSYLLVSTRDLIIYGKLSQPLGFIFSSMATYLLIIVSWIIYRLSMPIIRERVGA